MRTASMRASTLRVFLTALSLAVGLVLLVALATAYAGDTAAPNSPPDPNRVDVVVDLGNGNVLTRRVTFTEPTLNGLQVLQRSGLNLEIVTYSFGAAVCSIEGVGCPATNCFCNPDKFWGYLYWDDGWQGYPTGPSGRRSPTAASRAGPGARLAIHRRQSPLKSWPPAPHCNGCVRSSSSTEATATSARPWM